MKDYSAIICTLIIVCGIIAYCLLFHQYALVATSEGRCMYRMNRITGEVRYYGGHIWLTPYEAESTGLISGIKRKNESWAE